MNFNYPVVVTSKSIESNDDLELNAIAYTFSNIYQPKRKQFVGDRELVLAWVYLVSSQRRTEKLKKKHTFFAVEDFTLFWWHSGTQKRLGRAKQNAPNRQRSKTFLGKHCQNKTSKPE